MGPCPICGTGWGGLHYTLSVFLYGGHVCCVCHKLMSVMNSDMVVLAIMFHASKYCNTLCMYVTPISHPNCDSRNCVVICGDFTQLLPMYIDPYFPHTFTDSWSWFTVVHGVSQRTSTYLVYMRTVRTPLSDSLRS